MTISIVGASATLASFAYSGLCVWSGIRFNSSQPSLTGEQSSLPPVSILKPLKGTDPQMYDALRSHCLQEYPQYEILFGVTDAADPALPLVERLIAEFPQCPIRLVDCNQRLGANGKVSSLLQLARSARHNFLLLNDSDIRVEADYLRRVMTELDRPGVGLVTCLYRAVPAASLGSRFEALTIATDFVPGVLAARAIENGLA
ncbi:MAG: glycosyltransferase, partial [Acidobacteria bacterium]|nr:glycosyltransferase [Acidobacteriota bacterium]